MKKIIINFKSIINLYNFKHIEHANNRTLFVLKIYLFI
jgi:hypothetical protein